MKPVDHAFIASWAETTKTILESAMLCSSGIVMLLNYPCDQVDWNKIADLANRVEGAVEDLCAGELAVIGEYLDDPQSAYTERWSIRFGSVLSALRFEVRPYAGGDGTMRSMHMRIVQDDPNWALEKSQRISKLMAQCEPYAHTLTAISDGGPVRDELATKAHASGGAQNPSNSGEQPPDEVALTTAERTVLAALSAFDNAELVSTRKISKDEKMGTKTVQNAMNRLIDLDLAERPNGGKHGARLKRRGRLLAQRLGLAP